MLGFIASIGYKRINSTHNAYIMPFVLNILAAIISFRLNLVRPRSFLLLLLLPLSAGPSLEHYRTDITTD